MVGILYNPSGQWFVWRAEFTMTTQHRLVYFSNPKRDITINNLELCDFLDQTALLWMRISPLVHIHTRIENTSAKGWNKRDSVITATSAGPLLHDTSFLTRKFHVPTYILHIAGKDNRMADIDLRIPQLSDTDLIWHFRLHFPNIMHQLILLLIDYTTQDSIYFYEKFHRKNIK